MCRERALSEYFGSTSDLISSPWEANEANIAFNLIKLSIKRLFMSTISSTIYLPGANEEFISSYRLFCYSTRLEWFLEITKIRMCLFFHNILLISFISSYTACIIYNHINIDTNIFLYGFWFIWTTYMFILH